MIPLPKAWQNRMVLGRLSFAACLPPPLATCPASKDNEGEHSDLWRPTEVNAYEHTQRAPLHWLLYPPGVFLLTMAWLNRGQLMTALILSGTTVIVLAIGFSFQHLTIRDEDTSLAVRYGPLPIFRTRIAYADIARVKPGRTSWIDGWGIHWIPGRGYTYNLWGFACVELEVRNRIVRLGSDDVENLLAFLKTKLPQPSQPG
jgi:hypothetical protein